MISHIVMDNNGNYHHKTVELVCPFTKDLVAVNEGFSELIFKLWSIGIETTGQSEETQGQYKGCIWIQFKSQDYMKFMSIICDYDDPDTDVDSLYDKALNQNGIYTRFNLCDTRLYIVDFWNDFKDTRFEEPKPQMEINCNVWLLKEYYPIMLDKVNKWLPG